ncbi:MAG: peptidoglycan-binding domain-containing protein, partial [Spirulinaceae cyanobacterium]
CRPRQCLSLVGLIGLLGLAPTRLARSAPFLIQPALGQSVPSQSADLTKRVLKRGDRGNDVTRLQQQLQQVGVFSGPVTGYFGPKTESAVRQFQRSRSLPVDGIAGTRTQSALRAAANNSGQPTFTPFRRGAQGELVRQMQFRLLLLGYLNGSVTRNFDNTTQQALMNFQRSRGLSPDGVVGQRTWSSLQKAISSTQIRGMQGRLRTAGFYSGSIDGRLSTATQQAVEAAQRVYGVGADDILQGSY